MSDMRRVEGSPEDPHLHVSGNRGRTSYQPQAVE
jgi:hypothetical protein